MQGEYSYNKHFLNLREDVDKDLVQACTCMFSAYCFLVASFSPMIKNGVYESSIDGIWAVTL